MCITTSLIILQLFELSAIVVATTPQVTASFLLMKIYCTHQRPGCLQVQGNDHGTKKIIHSGHDSEQNCI
jgi:hypothetical protein